jgi:radical SAM protein with 4Fe4S-binding SPASM domain
LKFQRLPGSGCSAGFFVCAISPNGNIKGCPHSVEEYGNVLKLSIKKAYKTLEPYRKNILKTIPSVCKKCGKLLECKAICRETIKVLGNDPWIKNPFPKRKRKKEICYSKKEKEYLLNSEFVWNDDIKWRKENFGCIIVKERRVLPLNQTFFKIFMKFKQPFKPSSLFEKTKLSENEICSAVSFLLLAGVIKKISL